MVHIFTTNEMNYSQFPVKGHKMSNPGQIQDRVNCRTDPWNKGLLGESRTDGHLRHLA